MQLNRKFLGENKESVNNVEISEINDYPEKVIQFGEGNFLRSFVDWHFNELNKKGLFNGKIVIVQPLKVGMIDALNEQDGLYTLLLRGIQDGNRVEKTEVIASVSRGINPYSDWNSFLDCALNPDLRFMVSNTTEAGIAYIKCDFPKTECPDSFPAKVTAFLYSRFQHFNGEDDKGMIIIPCELIESNGDNLKKVVLQHAADWNLEKGFIDWIEQSNYFFNTLVDRIVPGYPKDEIEEITERIGYEDKIISSGEIFHQWVIEGNEKVNNELPFVEAGLNVIWTDDVKPYRTLKVRILNGAHTTITIPSFLAGNDTVRETVENELTGSFLKQGLFSEIIPTLDFDEDKKLKFASAVMERFQNPFIKHYLLSISLNSVSKYKVRVLPSLLKYKEMKNGVPDVLSFSLAALIEFYKEGAKGNVKGRDYKLNDSPKVIDFFADLKDENNNSAVVEKVLKNKGFWGMDLTSINGLESKVAYYYELIRTNGSKEAMEKLMS